MKFKLIFDDWRDKNHKSIYSTETGIELSLGDLHSGTTFDATIDLSPYDENLFKKARSEGIYPVFYAIEE